MLATRFICARKSWHVDHRGEIRERRKREPFQELDGRTNHRQVYFRARARHQQPLGPNFPEGSTLFEVIKLCSAKAVNWPLYCMPTSAGSIDSYFDLARIMVHKTRLYMVLPCASDDKLERIAVAGLAFCNRLAWKAPHLNGPIYLLGYSFAGHLAIETARQLAEHGVDVPLVAVADQVPHGNSFSLGFRIRYFVETFGPWTLRVATSYVTDATQRLIYAMQCVVS